MDPGAKTALITGLFTHSFLLNLPFGYLRNKTKRLSLKWFLCIHLPIPVVLAGRLLSDVDFTFVPIFLIAALAGQLWGGKLEF